MPSMLTLTLEEARTLASTGRVTVRRKMRKQPEKVRQHERYLTVDDNGDRWFCGIRCPFRPGQVIAAKEPWIEGFPTGERKRWSCIKPTNFEGHGKAFYRASSDDPPEEPRRPWCPASYMPDWAVRFRPTVKSVRAVLDGVWKWEYGLQNA